MSEQDGSRRQPIAQALASCLATAAVLTTSLSADASMVQQAFGSSPGIDTRREQPPVMMTLAEEGPSIGIEGGAVDLTRLIKDLEAAKSPESTLKAMVNINKMLDSDVDGLLEDPMAKESIVNSLLEKRNSGGAEVWDNNTQMALSILKRKLDPYNVVLLRPYLKVAPYLGGIYYLAALFVQQKARPFFPIAYFSAVALFVAPVAAIVIFN
ncbi:unnamed protein product [Choristocarpus tenellus]